MLYNQRGKSVVSSKRRLFCAGCAAFAGGVALELQEPLEQEEAVHTQTAEELSQTVQMQTVRLFRQNVRILLSESLAKENIFPEEIVVNVHVAEESNIYITGIVIKLFDFDAAQAQSVREVTEKETGMTPEILTGGETQ